MQAIMKGCRCYLRNEDETMLNIYRGMFFKNKVGNIIPYRPVRFQIAAEFKM